jgi:hypothetical protein
MTKEYNRFYEYITSTECYGGFPYHRERGMMFRDPNLF